ncbi:MAG: hypothetical protein KDC92_13205 [Bacteroidetes bacterium]|nr:hypothetical protein [Bacteroidota bacterium]
MKKIQKLFTHLFILGIVISANSFRVQSATYDLEIINGRMVGGQFAVDIVIASNSNFTLGANGTKSELDISHTNYGTAHGQIVASALSGGPSGYNTTLTENGVDGFKVSFNRSNGNYTVSTSPSFLITILFNVGGGATSINSTNLNWETATTIIYDVNKSAQTQGNLVGLNQGPLPIELSKIEIKYHQNDIYLDWTTSSELNNEIFEILASKNGTYFSIIGLTPGAGTSNSEIHYTFYLGNKNDFDYKYIKLKQTDYDGSFQYSKILTINDDPEHINTIMILQTPSSIVISNSSANDSEIQVLNTKGQLVISKFSKSNNSIILDKSLLNDNLYIIYSVANQKAYKVLIKD